MEGIARYVQIKSAEAAEHCQPSPEYAALRITYHSKPMRGRPAPILLVNWKADLATWKRTLVYSFGAAEGMLLDRLRPKWKHSLFPAALYT